MAITRGARGIGLASAKAFAAQGSRVFSGDLDADLAAAAATGIGGHAMALDVRSRQSFATFLDAVEAAGAPLAGWSTNPASCRPADSPTRTTQSPTRSSTSTPGGVLIG
ncbi:SDR family oxidoreductase [Mycobacterium sp. ML4]